MPIEPQLGRPHTPGCDCDNPQCVRDRDNEREMLEVVGGVMPIDREKCKAWRKMIQRRLDGEHCAEDEVINDLFEQLDAKDAEIDDLNEKHQKILQWIDAYPEDIFVTKNDWVNGARHTLKGIKEIIDAD
ncbi:MAG: hypothetical protein ACYTBJ_18805 [Planctomycetota bacterium]|jgi:hypothetical protein